MIPWTLTDWKVFHVESDLMHRVVLRRINLFVEADQHTEKGHKPGPTKTVLFSTPAQEDQAPLRAPSCSPLLSKNTNDLEANEMHQSLFKHLSLTSIIWAVPEPGSSAPNPQASRWLPTITYLHFTQVWMILAEHLSGSSLPRRTPITLLETLSSCRLFTSIVTVPPLNSSVS